MLINTEAFLTRRRLHEKIFRLQLLFPASKTAAVYTEFSHARRILQRKPSTGACRGRLCGDAVATTCCPEPEVWRQCVVTFPTRLHGGENVQALLLALLAGSRRPSHLLHRNLCSRLGGTNVVASASSERGLMILLAARYNCLTRDGRPHRNGGRRRFATSNASETCLKQLQ